MERKKISIIVITSAIIIVMGLCILIRKNETHALSEVKLLEDLDSSMYAMFIETDNDYVEYNDNNSFPLGYKINLQKSKCIDNSGSEIVNALGVNDEKVTLTSNRTTYCYLYFDKNAGLQIREKNPSKLSDTIKGDMYRFQGNATDEIDNYICFGTSDKQTCLDHLDKYMYRIIGIEKSGRIKVIKKEALEQPYQWHTDYIEDAKLPDSSIFKAINGSDFLDNETYIPEGWKDKISKNNWCYGDMWSSDSQQAGDELYAIESGQEVTHWTKLSTEEDGGLPTVVSWSGNTVYRPGTTLYYKDVSEKWTDFIESKISLMYLHDYLYSVGDEAKCSFNYGEEEYSKCKLSWMHLSNNDTQAPIDVEWTMTRIGWIDWGGALQVYGVCSDGRLCGDWYQLAYVSVRPVFYINASQTLKDGTGKIDDPFIIEL